MPIDAGLYGSEHAKVHCHQETLVSARPYSAFTGVATGALPRGANVPGVASFTNHPRGARS